MWIVPAPGARVVQTVAIGPFVVIAYSERSEIGLPCHVVHLRDEADDREYVLDTGLAGPGLPADSFTTEPADGRG